MIEDSRLKHGTVEDLIHLTEMSANAFSKELFIYEKSDLSDLIGYDTAERVRESFLTNGIKIRQITNIKNLQGFSENDRFVNECMSFRYVPENVYRINREVLIFDDHIFVYITEPEIKIMHIQDSEFSDNQKKLFINLWENSTLPNLHFNYSPEPSFFRSFDTEIDGKQLIFYPDIQFKDGWGDITAEGIKGYTDQLFRYNPYLLDSAQYFVCFLWANGSRRMIDIWKFSINEVDDRPGPLGDVFVFEEFERCNNDGIASGNTLLVLGYEERRRRQSSSLNEYLSGENPQLPFDLVSDRSF